MKDKDIFEELKSICRQLSIKIIYEASGNPPGYAVVGGKKYIVINKYYTLEQKIDTLSEALKETDLEGVFLKPIIRNLLEDNRFDF